jgi:hypothetical protein
MDERIEGGAAFNYKPLPKRVLWRAELLRGRAIQRLARSSPLQMFDCRAFLRNASLSGSAADTAALQFSRSQGSRQSVSARDQTQPQKPAPQSVALPMKFSPGRIGRRDSAETRGGTTPFMECSPSRFTRLRYWFGGSATFSTTLPRVCCDAIC